MTSSLAGAAMGVAWTLEEGLQLVRVLQPGTRKFNYHLTLGGSVLNQGHSDKDLDLFFLPMDNGESTSPEGLVDWLAGFFGPLLLMGKEYGDSTTAYRKKLRANYLDKRVDLFIS